MAAINLINGALSNNTSIWDIKDRDINACINIAKCTALLIEEDSDSDLIPSAEDVSTSIKQVFKMLNEKPSTKSAIVNALMLKGIKRNVAEYMVSKAKGMGIIKPHQAGNRTEYTLA